MDFDYEYIVVFLTWILMYPSMDPSDGPRLLETLVGSRKGRRESDAGVKPLRSVLEFDAAETQTSWGIGIVVMGSVLHI